MKPTLVDPIDAIQLIIAIYINVRYRRHLTRTEFPLY